MKHLLSYLKQNHSQIDLCLIISIALFYPHKESTSYYLVLAILIAFASLRNLFLQKNFSIQPVSMFLIAINIALLVCLPFTANFFTALEYYLDVFLISFYISGFYLSKSDEQNILIAIGWLISIFSLINLLWFIMNRSHNYGLFFDNPILPGIVSGVGVLICLFSRMESKKFYFLILIAINLSGVYVSGSKAAFLGLIICLVYIGWIRYPRLAIAGLLLLLLSIIVPNPMKTRFLYTLKNDPFAFDRLKIWQVSLKSIQEKPWFGLGLGNFELAAPKYNVKINHGPANYYKCPRQTHNDYFKIAAETGLIGIVLLGSGLFLLILKIFQKDRFHINKILLLYLLIQAFLYNLLFLPFFLLLVLILIKQLWNDRCSFISMDWKARSMLILFLVIVFGRFYALETLVDREMVHFKKTGEIAHLNRAMQWSPLNAHLYVQKANALLEDLKKTMDLTIWLNAHHAAKQAQKLNKWLLAAYQTEVALLMEFDKQNQTSLLAKDEILKPLFAAEYQFPLNPFLKLQIAEIYYLHNDLQSAKIKAWQALQVEPNYVRALYFLHTNFQYLKDDDFFNKIQAIQKIALTPAYQKNGYLKKLFEIPKIL
jgi:O-antigen ligase